MSQTSAFHPWATIRRQIKSLLDLAKWPSLKADRDRLDAIPMDRLDDLLAGICRRADKSHIMANQGAGELKLLVDQLQPRSLRTIVEIGTAQGGTFYLWSRLAQDRAMMASLDLPGAIGSVRRVNRSMYRTFGRHRGLTVHTLDADSHDPGTRARLERLLAGRRIDFLFIDGDHGYEGVKCDFELYTPLMAPDGLVAMHDIHVLPEQSEGIRVQRFWQELQQSGRYRMQALGAGPGQGAGIGLVSGPWDGAGASSKVS